jgi:hypothetical protein
MNDNDNGNPEARQEKRNAILTALIQAGGETFSFDERAVKPVAENHRYYSMSREEAAALVNGNIEKIENWINNLDRRHATSLLRWLIKDSA